MDNFRHPSRVMGTWTRHFVHPRRIYPYFTGNSYSSLPNKNHSRSQNLNFNIFLPLTTMAEVYVTPIDKEAGTSLSTVLIMIIIIGLLGMIAYASGWFNASSIINTPNPSSNINITTPVPIQDPTPPAVPTPTPNPTSDPNPTTPQTPITYSSRN